MNATSIRVSLVCTLRSSLIRTRRLWQIRYIGLEKARLGHLLTAAALNFLRLGEWFTGVPRAKTRRSPFATLMTDLIAACDADFTISIRSA